MILGRIKDCDILHVFFFFLLLFNKEKWANFIPILKILKNIKFQRINLIETLKKEMHIWDHVCSYFEFYDAFYLNLLYHEKK